MGTKAFFFFDKPCTVSNVFSRHTLICKSQENKEVTVTFPPLFLEIIMPRRYSGCTKDKK